MTSVGLEKMIQNFEKIGSFDLQSGRGGKRIDLMSVEVAAVVHRELPNIRSVSTMHQILQIILHCYKYRIRRAGVICD